MEVDPTFQRALQLLISRKPDSGEKLKEMLFESLGREYIPPSATTIKEGKLKTQVSYSHDSIGSLDDEDDEMNEMEAETDYSTDVGGAKNEDTMDADDFAFDMGISCVICRQFDVSSNNQLLECQECHSLYHQQCHKPPVKERQDDSPLVWHCHKCASVSKDVPGKVKAIEIDDNLPVKKEKSTNNDAFKKPSKKSEKSSGESKKSTDSSSKDKKPKTDKKVKERLAEKIKEAEKEKTKKHKNVDKESKSDGGRKEKTSSKSSDSVKSSAATSTKSTSKGADNHSGKQKSSSDLKHKKVDSVQEKDKKAKKIKREKAE